LDGLAITSFVIPRSAHLGSVGPYVTSHVCSEPFKQGYLEIKSDALL